VDDVAVLVRTVVVVVVVIVAMLVATASRGYLHSIIDCLRLIHSTY
jgi:hypothetical protein